MKPPTVGAVTLNVGHSAWSALVEVVSAVTKYLKERNDRHGRNPLLATYITYQVIIICKHRVSTSDYSCCQAHLPHLDPAISQYTIPQHHAQSEDGEISSIMAR